MSPALYVIGAILVLAALAQVAGHVADELGFCAGWEPVGRPQMVSAAQARRALFWVLVPLVVGIACIVAAFFVGGAA